MFFFFFSSLSLSLFTLFSFSLFLLNFLDLLCQDDPSKADFCCYSWRYLLQVTRLSFSPLT